MNVVSIVIGVVQMYGVEEGVIVEAGDHIMSVESMKMWFDIYAPCNGIVHLIAPLGKVVQRGEVVAIVS